MDNNYPVLIYVLYSYFLFQVSVTKAISRIEPINTEFWFNFPVNKQICSQIIDCK